MALNVLLLSGIIVILNSLAIIEATILLTNDISKSLNRSSFPQGFIFGTSSSAYQVFQIFQYSFTRKSQTNKKKMKFVSYLVLETL